MLGYDFAKLCGGKSSTDRAQMEPASNAAAATLTSATAAWTPTKTATSPRDEIITDRVDHGHNMGMSGLNS